MCLWYPERYIGGTQYPQEWQTSLRDGWGISYTSLHTLLGPVTRVLFLTLPLAFISGNNHSWALRSIKSELLMPNGVLISQNKSIFTQFSFPKVCNPDIEANGNGGDRLANATHPMTTLHPGPTQACQHSICSTCNTWNICRASVCLINS